MTVCLMHNNAVLRSAYDPILGTKPSVIGKSRLFGEKDDEMRLPMRKYIIPLHAE